MIRFKISTNEELLGCGNNSCAFDFSMTSSSQFLLTLL
jgi:hypothetical protein